MQPPSAPEGHALAPVLRPLTTGNWLFGLLVLTAGVFVPLLAAWRKLFGSSSTTKRSQ